MANPKILQPFLLSWEGGYVNNPKDPGGATNKGVTIATFRSYYGKDKTVQDLKNITDEQWLHIFKVGYWDKWKADQIKSQSIANLCVDWVYNSGKHGITNVQKLLGVTVDGIVGPKTLAALNAQDPQTFFKKLHAQREIFYRSLSTFKTFGTGWLRRNNSIGFGYLILNDKARTKITFKDEA